ncbi:MAG: hypothetical protein AABZ55_01335 [Bdellovibrionota bacterium]
MAKPTGAPTGKPAPTAPMTSAAPTSSPKGGKGPAHVAGDCMSWGCKVTAKRFNFCDEHFDHFKFGLIKKNGEPVPDYEKKIGHYQEFLARKGARKVA